MRDQFAYDPAREGIPTLQSERITQVHRPSWDQVGAFRELEEVTKGKKLFNDRAVQRLEDDRHEIVALGTFDLFEGLDVVVLGTVHDREDFGNEAGFIAGPLASGTIIS